MGVDIFKSNFLGGGRGNFKVCMASLPIRRLAQIDYWLMVTMPSDSEYVVLADDNSSELRSVDQSPFPN